ncbi:hypothetical protein C3Y87_02860 [Carbonactinospora thermoautotrophica]|uniref:hypothetical protein n=1 Tax=Carbonactinospora thermoautotrophica TaxID=1469144 RepID=UPI0022722261|nr:hypothetical protein [Carbonactinospora thermoautotrophica]MCX9190372.1 hypothetical protein [Carbonactinospora thermoautotrophica]
MSGGERLALAAGAAAVRPADEVLSRLATSRAGLDGFGRISVPFEYGGVGLLYVDHPRCGEGDENGRKHQPAAAEPTGDQHEEQRDIPRPAAAHPVKCANTIVS